MINKEDALVTPALLFDDATLLVRSRALRRIADTVGSKFLFALKSLAFAPVLETIKPSLDGFACSSLFEAKLARDLSDGSHTVHLTTPGLRSDEIGELAEICDYISFNSLTQWRRFRKVATPSVSCGLRINPQLSFVDDQRYDPCRQYSKLGSPMDQVVAALADHPDWFTGLRGIHLHNNCDSDDFAPLLETVRAVESRLSPLLERLEWVNLGGGYLFEGDQDVAPLREAVELLRSKYHVTVFIEPGSAVVREAGRLVSSVVDLFTNDGRTVAVLDTTVNHMPELFEYQCPPTVAGAREGGRYAYTLVGSTCLAGDLFGEFTFDEPLEVGSRVEFADAGAYTWVKAHMFNGINLPTIYSIRPSGNLVKQQQSTYEDFVRRNGAEAHALV